MDRFQASRSPTVRPTACTVTRGERTFRLFLSRRWQVTFVDVGGAVSYVAVSVGVTGL